MTSKSKYHNVGEERRGLCIATMGINPQGKVFPIRCKRWDCPVCAPINALFWAIEVADGMNKLFEKGVKLWFITITQSGKVKTVAHAYKILHHQWGKFQNRARRWCEKNGIEMYYAAFVEGQERRQGMPHFHIIASFGPTERELKEWAVKSGLGFKVDIQACSSKTGTAWYVSKYSTKSSDAKVMPKGFRRCRLSQNWPKMVWRNEVEVSVSIVKQFNESYKEWSHRAALELGIPTQMIIDAAMELSAQAFDLQLDDIIVGALNEG